MFNAAKDRLHTVAGDEDELKNAQNTLADVTAAIQRAEERVRSLRPGKAT